ncbi:hypothetical protein RBG61_00310 [Paludicola sp. MB14-C6]|uniref:hypothetical protein n=1 Tax=Paludihabitans sp. MB14-C6 TaxID=3070656 RepID=UPI0027DCF892|nr:hypothetical protein [Paludicola sp. MB14-C6]WMJ23135.1 hypothetical protein RBG61_00310 [Paludicola sp. MB14-C6]
MKKQKLVTIGSIALTLILSLSACGTTRNAETSKGVSSKTESTISSESSEETSKETFLKEGDILTYTDTKNSPFEDCGLKIEVKQGKDGYVKFTKTDLEGKATVEYYNFDNATQTMLKHYYVGAMGTSFYYTYDLNKNELIKVEDKDHNDTTQKTKDSGRWDKAAKTVSDEVKFLQDYFKTQYEISILEACTIENFGQ